MKIPNLKEILKPRWAHKPGFGMTEKYVLHKRKSFQQSSAPEDPALEHPVIPRVAEIAARSARRQESRTPSVAALRWRGGDRVDKSALRRGALREGGLTSAALGRADGSPRAA